MLATAVRDCILTGAVAVPSIQETRRLRSLAAQRRTRRRRWWIGGIVAAFALLLLATLAAPPLLRPHLERRLAVELAREVSLGHLTFNPLTLTLTSHDLRVLDHDQQTLVAWQRLQVGVAWSTLWRRGYHLNRLVLSAPHGRLLVREDGSLNVSDLLAKFATPAEEAPSAPPPPLWIGHLTVAEATFDFADRSRELPFATALGPVSFTIENLTTAAGDAAPYRFTAVSEAGERLVWEGDVSAIPLRSSGRFQLDDLQLSKYAAYSRPYLTGDLRRGRLSFRGEYIVILSGEAPRAEVARGQLRVEDLLLAQRAGGQPIVALQRIELLDLEADALNQRVKLRELRVSDGEAQVRRAADGSLELAQIFTLPPATAPTTPDVVPARSPDVHVESVRAESLRFVWQDATTTPEPARVEGALELLELRELAWPQRQPIPVQARVALQPSGRLELTGQLQLDAPQLTAETNVEQLPLTLGNPYLTGTVAARLNRGLVAATGDLQAEWSPERGPTVAWTGLAAISDVQMVLAADNSTVAEVAEIALREIEARYDATVKVRVKELEVVSPRGFVTLRSDGSLNVAALTPTSSTTSPTPVTIAAAGAPEIVVERTVVRRAAVSFRDESVRPEVKVDLEQFDGNLGTIASHRPATAPAAFRGRINQLAHLEINGEVNPLAPDAPARVKVAVRQLDLLPTSPYLAKYAGYRLDRGQLTLDVTYQLENRRWQAENRVLLDHFTLGAATPGPDATKLPVSLAIALLKDRHGRIALDLPVEGNLDEPGFSFGPAIARVVTTLLARAATSPFALLGALRPSGTADDGSTVLVFAPGQAELEPEAERTLRQLALALQERPALALELLEGRTAEADRQLFQDVMFDQLLAQRIERAETRESAAPLEPAARREQVLRHWYLERFPQPLVLEPEQARALQAAQMAAASSDESGDRGSPGFWRRVWQAIGIGSGGPSPERGPATDLELEQALRAITPDLATMEQELRAVVPVAEDDLAGLAAQRAAVVLQALSSMGVDPRRVVLTPAGSQTFPLLRLR
jgi:hypothetical protein